MPCLPNILKENLSILTEKFCELALEYGKFRRRLTHRDRNEEAALQGPVDSAECRIDLSPNTVADDGTRIDILGNDDGTARWSCRSGLLNPHDEVGGGEGSCASHIREVRSSESF